MKTTLTFVCLLALVAVAAVGIGASETPGAEPARGDETPVSLDELMAPAESPDLFTPAPQARSCSCTFNYECEAICFDGGQCLGGECACNTGSPQCGPGGGGGGPGGGECGACDDNDDCIGCGPEYVCASWGQCEAV